MSTQVEANAPSSDHPVIQRIHHYIEAEYRNVTLEDVARFVHMNPSYVSSYFRKLTGHKFSDYVLAVRMKKQPSFCGSIVGKHLRSAKWWDMQMQKFYTRF